MRPIDADAFLEKLKEYHDYIMQDPEVGRPMKWREAVCFGNTVNVLMKMPTIEAAPVVHGRWIDHMVRDWRCSECGEQIFKVRHVDGYCYDDKPNYCPNCGAKMDGRSEVE